MIKHRISGILLMAVAAIVVSSCSSIDDSRLPASPVNIVFTDVGMWNTYGVGGALDTRTFIKADRVPANFPYALSTYTGYGGILLVCDLTGNPVAYDLACPVECRPETRVFINDDLKAECPVCHSTYSVFENYGHPLSGTAAQRGYGLQHYHISVGGMSPYAIITR